MSQRTEASNASSSAHSLSRHYLFSLSGGQNETGALFSLLTALPHQAWYPGRWLLPDFAPVYNGQRIDFLRLSSAAQKVKQRHLHVANFARYTCMQPCSPSVIANEEHRRDYYSYAPKFPAIRSIRCMMVVCALPCLGPPAEDRALGTSRLLIQTWVRASQLGGDEYTVITSIRSNSQTRWFDSTCLARHDSLRSQVMPRAQPRFPDSPRHGHAPPEL